MYNPSFLLGGIGSLIGISIIFGFLYSKLNISEDRTALVYLFMYASMWGIFILTNVIGSLKGTSPANPNVSLITVAFISSIVYFTIVGLMIMFIKLCPDVIPIFNNSISYLIVTQILPLFWFNTYTETEIDKFILVQPVNIKATIPMIPIHLLIPFFKNDIVNSNANGFSEPAFNTTQPYDTYKIRELITLLQTVSIFIIMVFSLIVAFLVSNIAIQIESVEIKPN